MKRQNLILSQLLLLFCAAKIMLLEVGIGWVILLPLEQLGPQGQCYKGFSGSPKCDSRNRQQSPEKWGDLIRVSQALWLELCEMCMMGRSRAINTLHQPPSMCPTLHEACSYMSSDTMQYLQPSSITLMTNLPNSSTSVNSSGTQKIVSWGRQGSETKKAMLLSQCLTHSRHLGNVNSPPHLSY